MASDSTLAALNRNQPNELLHLVVAISLNEANIDEAIEVCSILAKHPDANVRGNALLGFGHIARRFNRLPKDPVETLVKSGLKDSSAYVQAQSLTAVEDIEQFVGWKIA
ncbi:hypothetical protein [Chitinimonas sp. BJYL2]|uniref:hypothetical protein n=1 Tax=Chitinimonas sp. BJYL2 TaxID=2976696 RepID=UPI0022B4113F|nr:hypothetical protein [Chitinimonas sp. BJYL2]